MTDTINTTQKPYYEGRELPLDSLSPDEFEDFIFSCLLSVDDVLGLKITGRPSGSGDGGFDVQGEVISSKRLACVQCKRQKTPLGAAQAAEELAKVAATSKLEGSNVGEHKFICTGGIRNILTTQLREESRQKIALEAGRKLASAKTGTLATLREKLEKQGANPNQVATEYVLSLDKITAWGIDEFNAALSPRWSDVLKVVERYFRIASVVREHPRAVFDRAAYIAEHKDFQVVIRPRFTNSQLTEEISVSSAENPSEQKRTPFRHIKNLSDFIDLGEGDIAVVLGDGGIGKSTALKLLRAEALRSNPGSLLPIIISLAAYTPGGLDRAIHQELGVDYGTWRTLPDHILLLCDGLNECPSTYVGQFFDELKPLLKRKSVACIISSRESSKHKKVVLPCPPAACVKLDALTPIAISQIAEHQLPETQTKEFISAYRSLADGSWSPLLWTPFAVMVAIRLWKKSSSLPDTLGEMLEELLQARCERDSESAKQGPSSVSILALAGAVAFQCLIIDRRLECPLHEAGKYIREARKYCAEAFGIADLTDIQIVELLTRHELLKVSARDVMGFGHQLLAGALAAPVLAREWQNHLDCLGEPVADDAWVFAARFISTDQVKEVLKAAFHIDLILGARTARELSSEFHKYAEKLIDLAVAEGAPEVVRHQGLRAYSILASNGAILKLKTLINDENSPIHFAACRALAASGNIDYLTNLLPRIDKMRSFPVKMSGGEVDVWETAPLPTRLDLARKRLSECNSSDMVGESLSLITYESDPSDIPLVEKFLGSETYLSVWQRALYALHRMSPSRAVDFLGSVLSETSNPVEKAALIHTAERIGIAIDLKLAFELATMVLPPDENGAQSEHYLHNLISDILTKSTLPEEFVTAVEHELPQSTGAQKSRLWRLSFACNSHSIAKYALNVIERWDNELGNACNYFIEQPDLANTHRDLLIELCEKGLENEQSWYTWGVARALELIAQLEFTEKATSIFTAMAQRLDRVRHAIETDTVPLLAEGDAQVLNAEGPEHDRFDLEMFAAQLISVAAKAQASLSDEVLLSFLKFSTQSIKGSTEHLREVLSRISDTSIDNVINQIDDFWTRISSLAVVCPRGATESRISLLTDALRQSYRHPASLKIVQESIEACWCPPICKMVMKVVSEIQEWSDYDSQFFWDFVKAISGRLGTDDQGVIEAELSRAQTAFARRILEIWYFDASKSRIGLSVVSSPIFTNSGQ